MQAGRWGWFVDLASDDGGWHEEEPTALFPNAGPALLDIRSANSSITIGLPNRSSSCGQANGRIIGCVLAGDKTWLLHRFGPSPFLCRAARPRSGATTW